MKVLDFNFLNLINLPFYKFLRRTDINPELRMIIALQALLYSGEYGLITQLAKQHNISRQMVYELRDMFMFWAMFIFSVKGKPLFCECDHQANEELIIISHIVALRLEGRCPIMGIHLLLRRQNSPNSSVGYISQLLNEIGAALSNTIELPEDYECIKIVFASDEIFSKGQPILITIDPVSSAIVRIELVEKRTSQSWQEHWQQLQQQGVTPIYLTNDEGTAMASARKKVLENTPRQSDTFHAIAHRIGKIVNELLKKAYKAIEEEYDKERKLQNAKSQQVIQKRMQQYQQARQQAEQAIQSYEEFSFLYQCIIESLHFFDNSGQVNTAQKAKQNILCAIDWIRQLTMCNQKINRQLDYIENNLSDMFLYLNLVQKIIAKWETDLKTPEQKQAFRCLCKAYQYTKNSRKIKNNKAKRYYLYLAKEQVEKAGVLLNNTDIDVELWWKQLCEQLDRVVQSSAMVETINSIVRSYLNNSKNQLNQNQLNLIMFYHNHRRYMRGKRKGFTPMELLTGQEQQKDWLELIMDKFVRYRQEKKQPKAKLAA